MSDMKRRREARCDSCISCGYQFASGEEADWHNWCCDDCNASGGIRAIEDPTDPDIAMTATGVVLFRLDPDYDPPPPPS
jgi:hypothetical protein